LSKIEATVQNQKKLMGLLVVQLKYVILAWNASIFMNNDNLILCIALKHSIETKRCMGLFIDKPQGPGNKTSIQDH